MSGINLRRELVEQGRTPFELSRQVRDGGLVRVRRGAYADASPAESPTVVTHRELLEAVLRQVSPEAVVSHVSAAVLHGLPTWSDQLGRAHITRDRPGGGRVDRDLVVHGRPLVSSDVAVIDGRPVTSLARTVLDLACTESIERGVAVGDAALRLGLDERALVAVVAEARRRHGIGRARAVSTAIDVRSESVGESFSRIRFSRWGLPAPILQVRIVDQRGQLVARTDFGWPELGTLGEFDGDVKYGALVPAGQTIQDVILAEKRREERVRELGWQVVRWQWADLWRRAELTARLEAAFRRGAVAPPAL